MGGTPPPAPPTCQQARLRLLLANDGTLNVSRRRAECNGGGGSIATIKRLTADLLILCMACETGVGFNPATRDLSLVSER